MEAEHPAHTDGHIGVAAEIEIDLEGIAKRHQPAAGKAHSRQRIQLGNDDTAGIGQQHLLGKADEEPQKAVVQVTCLDLPLAQAGSNVGVVDDGTGDELREKGEVSSKINDHRIHIPAVNMLGSTGIYRGQRSADRTVFGWLVIVLAAVGTVPPSVLFFPHFQQKKDKIMNNEEKNTEAIQELTIFIKEVMTKLIDDSKKD
mgnify:CR=1 FL=1